MEGFRAGVGMSLGAGLGLLFGLMFFANWWIGPVIVVALGLLVGPSWIYRRVPREIESINWVSLHPLPTDRNHYVGFP
jgi:hypothetical protein